MEEVGIMAEGSSMDRRSFVKAAAAVIPSAAALGSMVGAARATHAPQPGDAGAPATGPTGNLRIGVIGCGGRGTGAAIQALRADPNSTIVAMGDVFGDRIEGSIKSIAKAMGEASASRVQVDPERRFVGFDAYQKVIDSGVDVVLLCSYPAFRPAHLAAAVAAGKHVFAEKPLAVDAPGTRSVIESSRAAASKNLGLLVGFCWRFNPGVARAFEQIHRGAIGEVTGVYTTYLTSTLAKRPRKPEWSDMEFQLRNWWHFTWVSGDHIVEQAVHAIDRLSWAKGERLPARVTCLGGRAARTGPESGHAFDHFAATFEYDDGSRAFHATRQIDGCPSDNSDYVEGVKGRMVVNPWAPLYEARDHKGALLWKGEGAQDDTSRMYQIELDELFRSIRAGRPINDGERGANSCQMAIMARMAAYTGQTITWDQAMSSAEDLLPKPLEFGPLPTPEIAIPGKTKFV